MRYRLAWMGGVLCAVALDTALGDPPTAPAASAASTAQRGGIWKAVVPPTAMHGEFDSYDPIGVAAGARIKADCSLNWVNPDDGARYCFSSGTSLELFLEDPNGSIQRARTRWRELLLKPQTPR